MDTASNRGQIGCGPNRLTTHRWRPCRTGRKPLESPAFAPPSAQTWLISCHQPCRRAAGTPIQRGARYGRNVASAATVSTSATSKRGRMPVNCAPRRKVVQHSPLQTIKDVVGFAEVSSHSTLHNQTVAHFLAAWAALARSACSPDSRRCDARHANATEHTRVPEAKAPQGFSEQCVCVCPPLQTTVVAAWRSEIFGTPARPRCRAPG
jgi:hypothetical protein